MWAVSTTSTLFLAVFWAGLTGTTEALQWTTTSNVHQMETCSGDNFTFPWTFRLDPGEELEDIKWLHTPDHSPSANPDLVANYIYGHFIAMPPFNDRLVYLGNGTLVLNRMAPVEAGKYIVEVVTTHHGGNGYSSARQQVHVDVVESPTIVTKALSVGMEKEAVYDYTSGDWHVVLSCGQVLSQNQSLPNVTWKTPSGSEVSSSYSNNGTFYLVVPNPVPAGTYTCHVPINPSAAVCLPSNSSLETEASLVMDGDMAGLALLRARQETLLGQNQQLSRLLALTQGQQALTDTMLSHARQELNVAMDMVSNATWELAGMKQELSKVQQHVSDMQRELAAVQGCCNADNTSSADSGKTMAAMTETNRELLETKDKLAVVTGDLTKVQRELGDVRRCCGTKDTFTTDTTFQKGPQTSYSPPEDKTSSSHESTSSMWNEMTSAEPASFVTKQNFAQITQELTSFQSQADKSWQDLSEHINVVEMSLKQYKDETSKTVAFHAQASQQQYSDKDHILFDEEVFLNDGSAFNKYSGEFVVPVSGTYVLLASTSASRMQGATCDADLVVDGRAVARMLGRYGDGDTQVTGHAVLHLHQGQRVWVRSIGATAIDIRSLFSGFLLKADL